MCDTCGCGDTTIVPVEILERLLSDNHRVAAHNREHFAGHRVLAVNLMSSPGSGKTAMLEATARAMSARRRLAAITGGLETDRDVRRLGVVGIRAEAITTGSACHLDVRMVHHALHHGAADDADTLFIENVGNLVWPAIYDLGEAGRGTLGQRGRGQAAEVPANVPRRRPRAAHQDRPVASAAGRR
jgi:hydrogenase nickel incorporation protein HypB